jgi:hypothetical protein
MFAHATILVKKFVMFALIGTSDLVLFDHREQGCSVSQSVLRRTCDRAFWAASRWIAI